jgi:signal transduction histidine kinase
VALKHGMRACWSTPIWSQDGRVLGSFGILYRQPGTPTAAQQKLIERFTNIASIAIERARSDAALKRSEAFLAEAQRLSSTGSFSWRVATDEIMWSDEAYRIYGIEPGTPVTFELIRTRVHPDNLPMLQHVIDRFRREAGDLDYETRLLLPDRSIKHLHVVAHGARNQDGELEVIGTIHDVTQRRLSDEVLGRLRSELAHMARATTLGALTASIAHEVNQPLAGIITNAGTCLRMLAADPPNIEGARETEKRTIRDGNRAADVITRLRALFSKKEFTLESLDLNDATREVIALSASELKRHRVIAQSELAEDLPNITGDRIQLQQVILNLLRNAAEAMIGVDDRPRHLLVKTERENGDRVRVIVRDTGVGIDPQSMNKLFDAFYTSKSGGMGIGLSISRSIIERHHGRLWAEPNEGPGATFSFSIPCDQESVSSAAALTASRTP